MFSLKAFVWRSVLLALFLAASYPSQSSTQYNPETTDVYLITVGVGLGIEARYGHTIFTLVDRGSRSEHNLNWGTFDFQDPMFLVNFFRGLLRYWVSDSSFTDMVYRYKHFEGRSLEMDKVELTLKQRAAVIAKVEDNLQPANKYFWYQFFENNCATIPRDILDAALGGEIRKAATALPASKNLRQYVRDHLSIPGIIPFLLEIVLNATVDRPVSQWDEMFYPIKLREYLGQIPAFSDTGAPVPGRSLLTPMPTLNTGPSPDSVIAPSPYPGVFVLVFGLLIVGLLLLGRKFRFLHTSFWAGRIGRLVLGVTLVSGGTLAGFLGLGMLVFWAFSGHKELYHNANLWLFWPIDVLFAALGVRLILGRLHLISARSLWLLRNLAQLHLWGFAIYLVLWKLGHFAQEVSVVATYLGPILFLYYTMVIGLLKYSRPTP